jgi:hypothetical protein
MEKVNEIATIAPTVLDLESNFANNIITKYALTTITSKKDIDYKSVKKEAVENIEALEPKDGLQVMLSAQMNSVHALQQNMMLYANAATNSDVAQKYVNIVTKLSNVFIQQANLIQKLKGDMERKIVIEHVHVHSGAQAVVGSVHTSTPHRGNKK